MDDLYQRITNAVMVGSFCFSSFFHGQFRSFLNGLELWDFLPPSNQKLEMHAVEF